MTLTRLPLLLLLLLLPAICAGAPPLAARQSALANALLEQLPDYQRSAAAMPWISAERTQWSYFPWGHVGLPLSELTAAQRAAALALLDSGLSGDGHNRARQVMELEAAEAERGFISRLWTDGGAYYTSIFGAPASGEPWSWRFEGHHLSVNMTLADGHVVAGTPYFIGADPAVVDTGRLAGLRILEREEVDARALFLSLDARQREQALIRNKAPRDILTGSDAHAALSCCEGVPYTALDTSQRGELLTLVERVAGQLHPEVAALHLDRLREAGVDALQFAWAGSEAPGEPHYYRIQGPTLLIEYANTQDDANHIHLVLRDPALDFGGDPLRAHVASSH